MELAKSLFVIIILPSLYISLMNIVLSQEDQFVYEGFGGANLTLNGVARILENGLLQLTNTSKQKIGHAFYLHPLEFNASRTFSFSTTFVFAVVPESPGLGGHGIAFTISPSTNFTGATATQFLGLFNSSTIGSSSNHVFAVELDTVQNPEFADINNNHVGVDLNNLTSIQSAPVMYFTGDEREVKNLDLSSGDPIQVWIDYDGVEKQITVALAPVRRGKPRMPLLSTNIDLSAVFLNSMYVGFTASTGSVSSHHYILGWSFNKSGEALSLDASKLPSLPRGRNSKQNLRILVPIMVVTLVFVVVSVITYIRRKKYKEVREDWEEQYGPQRFSYKELYKATQGFKEKQLLGSGGFGRVYKGVLPSSKVQVAVKKVAHDSKQGMKEFVAEIATMGKLRHRNLVQLLGYCRRKGELLLVYDYMENGSLDKFLFRNDKPNLNWNLRFHVIKGVASALLYLHEQWEQVVLHRDVKASNVLIDSDFNGRLGDFGLARFYDRDSVPQTTNVVGTIGYLAPELTTTGRATTSSDVFSFGVFLLEVACGRKPVASHLPPEQAILVEWVFGCFSRGVIMGTSDPKLEGNYEFKEMELVMKLALLCTHYVPANRPSMRQVVQYLDGSVNLPEILVTQDGIALVSATSMQFQGSRDESEHVNISAEDISSYSLSDTDSILSVGR